MRERLERVLYAVGVFPGRAASKCEVDEVIGLLAPIEQTYPLVRMGGMHDGGYVIPDDLEGVRALFSPGVSHQWAFEQEMLKRYGVTPVLCDRLGPNHGCPFQVDDVWLGPSSGEGIFSLSDWVNDYPEFTGDLIMQMDIEGAEYMTLLATPLEVLRRFRIFVIEFHNLQRVMDDFTLRNMIAPTLRKLDEIYLPVHIHANNGGGVDFRSGRDVPRVLEVTYHRRDRVTATSAVRDLPRVCDSPNVPELPDIQLSKRWLEPSRRN